jgi:hypothetical protein
MARLPVPLILFFGLFPFAYPQKEPPDQAVAITINAAPIPALETDKPSQTRFGSLEFRGGLVLTSAHKSFGGISALYVNPDGENFLAVSDRATWFRGRIVYENDRPVRIADAYSAPVLDGDGQPAPRWDTESIAVNGNTLYVGLERINSIFSFDYDGKSFPANARPVAGPPELKDLPFNQGLEAMVFVPKKYNLAGTLIGFSEKGLTAEGNLKAFLIGGPSPGLFAVKRTGDYDISDAAILPNGDILILERQYSLQRGVTMRIRRIRLADIKPGALVDGTAVVETGAGYQIDNMEALGVHRSRSGETVLTIMSDDNFSPIQRTLLLQFVLKGN